MTESTRVEDVSKDYQIRLSKAEKLKEMGLQAWPEFQKNSISIKEATETIKSGNYSEEDTFSFNGRLMLKREHGKTMFGTLKDVSGSLQIYVKQNIVGEELFEVFAKLVDIGDFLWVRGNPFVTKTGEPTLKVTNLQIASKCLRPLPEKFHGLTDVEQRYRQRYLDLICNDDSKERFQSRSKIVSQIRRFLEDENFLEVETPMLHNISGGAAAKPFMTKHNALGIDLALRIAPELYLKRLVVGGLDRVFEINRNFRNEGVSTKHNPEFTMLEFYMAYGDWQDGVRLLTSLIQNAALALKPDGKFEFGKHKLDFSVEIPVVDMADSIIKYAGFSQKDILESNIDATIAREKIKVRPGTSFGEKIYAIFEEKVEGNLVQPVFIKGFPIEVSPLAKKDPTNPNKAARFELFACGMELANGYTELNDPLDQAERFAQQVEAKNSGDDEAHSYDHDYILALEHGLPPTVGVGLGIDRLTMLLTNTQSIRDVILFPTLKPK